MSVNLETWKTSGKKFDVSRILFQVFLQGTRIRKRAQKKSSRLLKELNHLHK